MPITTAVNQFSTTKEEAFEWLHKEVGSLRSGRVKPDLVQSITVEAYGARSPLNGVASVSSSDARTLVVSPWDKNNITAVEKAITVANLGVQPIVDGDIIRLSFPSLTEEVREHILKVLHAKAEEARVRLRQGRDEALRILKQEKEKSIITEDDFYDGKSELDELIDKANQEVAEVVKRKEEEIKAV